MNIVFLIGNGFDINLGMKTSYADFYDDYINTYKFPSKPVERLMADIAQYKNTDLWADLEKGLGLYTEYIEDAKELREVYFHLNDALKLYLSDQKLADKYLTPNAASKLKKDLMSPQQEFRERLRQDIVNYMSPGTIGQDDVYIITFNYTKTIEQILETGKYALPVDLGAKNSRGSKRVLQSIHHIHGILSDTEVIMGVNDASQIKNDQLAKDPSAQSMLIKPETTINRGDMLDDKCEKIMNKADMYCLFGLSLGETDQKWWDLLKTRFNASNAHIIYYAHDKRPTEHRQDLWDMEREYRDMLLDKFTGKHADRAALGARIHVLVNSKMFKLE